MVDLGFFCFTFYWGRDPGWVAHGEGGRDVVVLLLLLSSPCKKVNLFMFALTIWGGQKKG